MVVRALGERLVNGIERSAFALERSVFVIERAVMRLCVQSPTPSALWNSSASVRVSRSVAHASVRVCARVRACVRWACVDLGVGVGVGVASDRYDGLTD
jgi:hypothetical protein